tara:strand:+ start:1075 stop:1569 length:495 start_codon:yes stop_codon:yes gene_type:complete
MNVIKNILFIFILLLIYSNTYSAETTSMAERICLAKNIYFESGNQPLAGRLAVAHVTLNRVIDQQFPNSICGVVYQANWHKNWKGDMVPTLRQCQFSWFCDGKSDEPTDSKTWIESLEVASKLLLIRPLDITEGALWYHADYSKPYWSNHLKRTVTIENHLFYK